MHKADDDYDNYYEAKLKDLFEKIKNDLTQIAKLFLIQVEDMKFMLQIEEAHISEMTDHLGVL
jgi:hypothetical protein